MRHRCINDRPMASGQTLDWEFELDRRSIRIKVTGPLTFNEAELMLEAALDGLGIAYIVAEQATPFIASGRLVRLLADWTPTFPGYFLYYQSRKQSPATLVALIAALRRSHAGHSKTD